MTALSRRNAHRGQRGFTLLELLVAMSLGLAVVALVLSACLDSLRARRQVQAVVQMNEDAAAALAFVAQNLRQAAYNPAAPGSAGGARDLGWDGIRVMACAAGFESATVADALPQCATGSATRPGAIILVFQGDAYNTVPDGAGHATDCTGAGVAQADGADAGFSVVQNRFYVSSGSLMCVGNGGGGRFARPVTLVENVEDMRFVFGVGAPGGTDGAVAGYLSAAQVGAGAGDTSGVFQDEAWRALTLSQRWARVLTVRVCLVMRSADALADVPAQGNAWRDCDGKLRTAADRRLHRAYGTTVFLRNRVA